MQMERGRMSAGSSPPHHDRKRVIEANEQVRSWLIYWLYK